MAVSATRSVVIGFTGDVTLADSFDAVSNTISPGVTELKILASGFNALTVPANAAAVTVIPPTTNANTLILKGVTGDTGVSLSRTEPSSIGLINSTTALGITVTTTTTVRLVWT